MAFLTKTSDVILESALRKVTKTTPITAVSPGSIARALIEAITTEIGDLYSVLDFNMSVNVISTAQGQSLDYIGSLYNITRKTLTTIATIDRSLGSFYFYIDAPFNADIVVAAGTRVYTDIDTFVGKQFSYATTEDVIIPIGRTRVYASIRPVSTLSVFTAGPKTLTVMDPNYVQPVGTTVKCTNPKPIVAQTGREDDESYRIRIIKAVRTSAGGTLEALRLVGLSVNGVRDVAIQETPFGLGSVQALVIPEDNQARAIVLNNAAAMMSTVKPVGVRLYVREPTYLSVEIKAAIVIRSDSTIAPEITTKRVQIGILRYLNTLLIGTTLVYSQLIESILDASDAVSDVQFVNLTVDGVEILRQNFTPESDQQLIPGEVLVTLASA